MITRNDLEAAIAECQGKRDPDAKTCIMLAAFYTIRREMFGDDNSKTEYSYSPSEYSYSSSPTMEADESTISIDSESEFAKAIDGREQRDVLPIIDELMETLSIIQPRLYDAVMDKLT